MSIAYRKEVVIFSEDNRATLAEYVNQTIPKDKRSRDYTAADIANDTDGITTQLGIMQFAGNEFINYADAIASLEADQAQEGAIGDVVGAMQQESAEEPSPSTASTPLPEGEAVQGEENIDANTEAVVEGKRSLSKTKTDRLKISLNNLGAKRISKQANNKKITIQTDDYTANKNIYSDKGRTKSEVNARIKNIENFEGLLSQSVYVGTDTNIRDLDKEAKKGVIAIHKFKTSIDGYDVEFLVRDKGKSQYLYEAKFIENKNSSQQSMTGKPASPAPKGDVENSSIISQPKQPVKTKSKNNSKRDLAPNSSQKSAEKASKAVESKVEEKSAEATPSTADAVPLPQEGGKDKPKIRKPKEEILTDVQRAERAKERAKKLIEYEATVKVTSKELNTAREYVKDFDSLPKGARQAVIKMIRSADGKIDKKILAGVANLMTMRRRSGELVMPDLELRFAEGIGDNGLYTHIGEGENRRVLILINSDADFKETVKGTIAHEVVHYIENRKGYRELAEYVMKTAKKEKIAEIEKEYNEHYKGIYTAEAEKAGLVGDAVTKKVAEKMATEDHKELIKSEVVAKLIGLRLNNEKFLKKYATKDDAMIKKIFRFLRASVSYLKDKDKATADEVTRLVNVFSAVIGSSVVSESEGTKTAKYSVKELYVQDLSEEEIERYYKTGKTGHAIHKKNDIKKLTGSAVLKGDSEIDSFIREAVKESKNINKGYAVVPKALSDKIAVSTDNRVLTENWFLELSSDDLFHLYREHHKAKDIGDLDMEIDELVRLPKKIDGTADFLGVERVKTQTKIKLGVKTESGEHYIVVELVSKDSKALRLKNAWKVTDEKYDGIKKEGTLSTHNRTNESPAISDDISPSTKSIPQKSDLSTGSEKKVDGKRDLAPRKADKPEKKIEKLEKEKAEAQAKAKQERSMREKMAREAAQVAKAEAAKVYTKKEIEGALKDVEAVTFFLTRKTNNGKMFLTLKQFGDNNEYKNRKYNAQARAFFGTDGGIYRLFIQNDMPRARC